MLAYLLAAVATAASTSAESPRQPTSRWIVNFDDAQCVASRDYGTDGDPLIFALKAPPIGGVMQLAVIRDGGGSRYAEHYPAEIELDGSSPIDATLVTFAVPETGQKLFRINLPLAQSGAIGKAKTIRIKARGAIDEEFALERMQPVLNLLADCTQGLREIWNIQEDEGPNPKLAQPSVGDLSGLFKASDYPAIALQKNASGSARLAVLINEAGTIADCTVIETSGFAALDAQSCAIVKERARFKPAIGPDGKPAKDAVIQRITWQIRG